MSRITIPEIDTWLQKLPPEKLQTVLDFVTYLATREDSPTELPADSDVRQTMIASETALRRDWGRPEEDAAWGHL